MRSRNLLHRVLISFEAWAAAATLLILSFAAPAQAQVSSAANGMHLSRSSSTAAVLAPQAPLALVIPSDSLPGFAVFNISVSVQGWDQVDNFDNCNEISTGHYTVDAPPQHGTLTYDIQSGFAQNACTITAATFNWVNYTLTDPNYSGSDTFSTTWTSDDGSVVESQTFYIQTAQGYKQSGNPTKPGQCACGDPIDVGSGNLFEQVTDYQTVGQNTLKFVRYYNSLSADTPEGSLLGKKWRSNYDQYLRLSSVNSNLTAILSREKMGRLSHFNSTAELGGLIPMLI